MGCMPSINIEGHGFYYSIKDGRAPSIMMLCSTGLDSRQWKNVSKLLPDRRLICLHYLGYFPSDSWDIKNPPDILIDFKAAECLLLQEESPVDLLGHSYGGFLALKLAIKHPRRIRKISIHEPILWGCLDSTELSELRNDFGEVVETFFKEELTPEEFLEDFIDYWNESGTWYKMSEKRKINWRKLQPKILAEARFLCYDKTPSSYWNKVKHPVFLTVGSNTPAHQFEVCRIINSSIPNIKLVEVLGGHMGILTNNQEILPLLTEWLE